MAKNKQDVLEKFHLVLTPNGFVGIEDETAFLVQLSLYPLETLPFNKGPQS